VKKTKLKNNRLDFTDPKIVFIIFVTISAIASFILGGLFVK